MKGHILDVGLSIYKKSLYIFLFRNFGSSSHVPNFVVFFFELRIAVKFEVGFLGTAEGTSKKV